MIVIIKIDPKFVIVITISISLQRENVLNYATITERLCPIT